MSNVKNRLQESKAKFEHEMIDSGESYGRDWAKDHAEYADLLRLKRSEPNPASLRDLFELVSGDLANSFDYDDFLRSIFGHPWEDLHEGLDNSQFCEGFVKGALALFREAMAA